MRLLATVCFIFIASQGSSRTLTDREATDLCIATYEGLYLVAIANAPIEVFRYSFFDVGATDYFDPEYRERLFNLMLHNIYYYMGRNKLMAYPTDLDRLTKNFCLPVSTNPWKLFYEPPQ